MKTTNMEKNIVCGLFFFAWSFGAIGQTASVSQDIQNQENINVTEANDSLVLSLAQCREMAAENNVKMLIAAKTAEKAGYTSKSLFANYLPKFSMSGKALFSSFSTEGSTPELYLPTYYPFLLSDGTLSMLPNLLKSEGGLVYNPENNQPLFNQYAYVPSISYQVKVPAYYLGGIKMEQPIYMGGKITAAYRMSTVGKEMAASNIKKTRAEVLLEADEAYWTLVKVNELFKTAEQYKRVLDELYRSVNNAYQSGMLSSNEVLKVRVKMHEAEWLCQQANNGKVLAKMNLCHRLGLPLTTRVAVVDTFDMETILLPEEKDITARPEYELLTQQIEMKTLEQDLVRSDFLPNVGMMASYSYHHGLDYSLGVDVIGMEHEGRLVDRGLSVAAVAVNIPVFHWGEGVNKLRAAQADREIIELQREQAAEMMMLELTKAKNEYEESILKVLMTAESLKQAEENMKISENQYTIGMKTLADYMESQTLWQKSHSEWIEAQTTMKLALSRYQKAAGKLE